MRNNEQLLMVTSGCGAPSIDCVISSVQIYSLEVSCGLPQVWCSSEGVK